MTETFSETSEAEGFSARCDPSIIPILPLRFAPKAESLLKLVETGAQTPGTPASIDDMPDHELLRIRRGFVYVYDGAIFQVFRFETEQGDGNGLIYDPQTQMPQIPRYTFAKYEWEDPSKINDDWTALNESYPYVFVPKDTPVAWVAYSESRWPAKLFYDIELNAQTRDEIMTRVDLASRSGPYCAPITELDRPHPGVSRRFKHASAHRFLHGQRDPCDRGGVRSAILRGQLHQYPRSRRAGRTS